MKLASMRVLIVSGNNAACVRLFRFLSNDCRAKEAIFIGHPFAADSVRRSQLMVSQASGETEWSIRRGQSYEPSSYLVDLLITLFMLLCLRRRYDLYISGVPHLVLLGLLLRRAGLARSTVYWTHDYHPARFKNKLLNWLYLKLDEICATHSDYTWNVVSEIGEHRTRRGIATPPDRVLIVGDPVEAGQMQWLAPEDIPAASVVNSGLVQPGYGFDLLLEALPLIVDKVPELKVTVTTYQKLPDELERRINDLGLASSFHMMGFIPDEDEYTRVLQRHRVGLALYEPKAGTHKRYSESRAKSYLARGVPVIITRVAPISSEIEKSGAGIVIEYDSQELAEAIVRLVSDDESYRRCRDNAISLAQRYRADVVVPAAFERMGIQI